MNGPLDKRAVHDILNSREKRMEGYSYKLAADTQYALDVVMPDAIEVDEGRMMIWIPYADGNNRDGVGDRMHVGGIRTDRHRKNPIVLLDHGKHVQLPIAIAEDRAGPVPEYKNLIDPVAQTAKVGAHFYQGKGLGTSDPRLEYDHAKFSEQIFDMMARHRIIRAGSIGYQVISARELPPVYEKGCPKGLDLYETLMLEGSAVVLPANGDATMKSMVNEVYQKCLGGDKVCGMAPSPYLIKGFAPYAMERKEMVTGGYEAKNIEPDEKAWDPNHIMVQSRVASDGVPPMDSVVTQIGYTKLPPGIQSQISQAEIGGEVVKIRQGYNTSYRTNKVGDRDTDVVWTAVGDNWQPTEYRGIMRQGPWRRKNIEVATKELEAAFSKSLQRVRNQYRTSAKGLRRRLKKSSPGKSLMHVASKDIAEAQKEAEAKGLEFHRHGHVGAGVERVKLIGDDKAIDGVAKRWGRRIKSLGLSIDDFNVRDTIVFSNGEEGVVTMVDQGRGIIYSDTREGEDTLREADIASRVRRVIPATRRKGLDDPEIKWDIYVNGKLQFSLWADTKEEAEDTARSLINPDPTAKVEARNPTRKTKSMDMSTKAAAPLEEEMIEEVSRILGSQPRTREEDGRAARWKIKRSQAQGLHSQFESLIRKFPGGTFFMVGDTEVLFRKMRGGRKSMDSPFVGNPGKRACHSCGTLLTKTSTGYKHPQGEGCREAGKTMAVGETSDYDPAYDDEFTPRSKSMETKDMSTRQTEIKALLKDYDPDAVDKDNPAEEKLGAQALRRFHQDSAILLADYHEMVQQIENETVKARLVKKCEELTAELEDIEAMFEDQYPDYDKLEDKAVEDDDVGDEAVEEAEEETGEDLDNDNEEGESEEHAEKVNKDQEEANDEDPDLTDEENEAPVGTADREEERPSEEEVAEAMQPEDEEEHEKKSLRQQYSKKGVGLNIAAGAAGLGAAKLGHHVGGKIVRGVRRAIGGKKKDMKCMQCGDGPCKCGKKAIEGQPLKWSDEQIERFLQNDHGPKGNLDQYYNHIVRQTASHSMAQSVIDYMKRTGSKKFLPAVGALAAGAAAVGGVAGLARGLTSEEKSLAREAGDFMGELAHEDSRFEDEHRHKSYYYHRRLGEIAEKGLGGAIGGAVLGGMAGGPVGAAIGGIAGDRISNKDMDEDETEEKGIRKTAGKIARGVGKVARAAGTAAVVGASALAVHNHIAGVGVGGKAFPDNNDPVSEKLDDEPKETADSEVAAQDANNDGTPTGEETKDLHPHRMQCKQISGFMKQLANEKAFGIPHREKCMMAQKALNDMADAPDEEQIEEDNAEAETEGETEPTGEVHEKSFQKGDRVEFDDGKVGTIVEAPTDSRPYKVRMDGGGYREAQDDEFGPSNKALPTKLTKDQEETAEEDEVEDEVESEGKSIGSAAKKVGKTAARVARTAATAYAAHRMAGAVGNGLKRVLGRKDDEPETSEDDMDSEEKLLDPIVAMQQKNGENLDVLLKGLERIAKVID